MAIQIAIPLFVTFCLFVIAFVLMTRHARHMQRQRNLPQREDFLAAHAGRAACPSCAGVSFREHGLDSGDDTCRIVCCAQCGALLYRYELPSAVE